MSQKQRIYIHADESCLGNQFKHRANPGGAAGLVEHWTSGAWLRKDYWVAGPDTTNNRMALMSAIVGMNELTRPCWIRFVSDSQYLIKGMNEWVAGWRARGWVRKGGAVENVDLWKKALRAAERHEVTWEWVRGHAGHPKNEYANFLAVRAAGEQTSSGGLVESGFEDWLDGEREKKQRYLDYFEFAAPEDG